MSKNKFTKTNLLELSFSERFATVWKELSLGNENTIKDFARKFYYRDKYGKAHSILFNVNMNDICCVLNNTGLSFIRKYTERFEEFQEYEKQEYCPAEIEKGANDVLAPVKHTLPYKLKLPNDEILMMSVRSFPLAFVDFQTSPSLINPAIDESEVGQTCLPISPGRTVYLRCDHFTNNVMTTMSLKYFLQKGNEEMNRISEHIINYRDVGICIKKEQSRDRGTKLGVILKENSKTILGSLDKISEFSDNELEIKREIYNITLSTEKEITIRALPLKAARGIINQIIAIYSSLQDNFIFRHNDAHVGNILIGVEEENLEGSYGGVYFQSPVKINLTNFQYASTSFPVKNNLNLRIYNGGVSALIYQNLFSFKPNIGKLGVEPYFIMDDLLKKSTLTYVRSSGRPYYAALDFYTMLVSIFMLRDFWVHVVLNPDFRCYYFNSLWFPSDAGEMYKRINRAHERNTPPSYTNIIGILRGIKLYCRLPEMLKETYTLNR